ncbi:hypothetical protein GQ56_0124845 [Burkholderia paludis]|nr:hypothetical protein GQ56_0124845 [Burkholderia paludis]
MKPHSSEGTVKLSERTERFCTNGGHALVEFGAEISEQLDVIPEQRRVIQHPRVKYAWHKSPQGGH